METLSTNKIADLSGVSHATARRRLVAGGAVADPNGGYTLREVLQAWEKLASGKVGELNASEAKARLANLRIEKETIELRKLKGELVQMEPWMQYMRALSKCLWSRIQSLRLPLEDVKSLGEELNRVTREFVQQNFGPQLLTLEEAEEQAEMEREEQEEHE